MLILEVYSMIYILLKQPQADANTLKYEVATLDLLNKGKANLANLKSGKYYVVGASTLGQVGVVWSKPITLSAGSNQMSLDLRDAEWAE